MKNLLKFVKKNNYQFLTIILGMIVVISIFISNEIAPFGEKSLLDVDFFHQYGPMLSELFDRILSGESLIYSFNTGLGIPFFRTFFNYLASPLNVLMFLFQRKDLLMSYSFIIGLRSIISAITLVYYLRKKFSSNNLLFVGLGLLYAYSAYFTAYYWNIMWLDGMIFLPLIALGIENIINKNNGFLYTISLALLIYSNYFIGYMLCIFSCIYFLAYLIIKTDKLNLKKIFKTCILFALCSLISGAINAWALIPMYDALKTTNATTGSMPMEQYYIFTILDFFRNHLTGVTSTVFYSGTSNIPNVSCGILSVALFFIFLLSSKVSLKRKIVYTSMLLLLLLSFYVAPLDYIWHAFHVPNDLPYRYSFIYSFILIITNAYALKDIKNISFVKVFSVYIICLIYITFVHFTNFENISNSMITLNYILISVYFIIYVAYKFLPRFKKIDTFVFLIVVAIECIISVNHNWNISQYIDDFYYDYSDVNSSVKLIKKEDDDIFYRTEKNNMLTHNDGTWYDYYGQAIFSSMAYNKLSELNYNLGMPGNYINSYYYRQNTPIYDLMFDIKYQVNMNTIDNRYELYTSKNKTQIYKFKYTTGLMYGVNEDIKNWKTIYSMPFQNQNDFIESTTGISNTLYELEFDKEKILFGDGNETVVKLTYINQPDNIYIYPNDSDINYIIVNDSIYYKESVNWDSVAKTLDIENITIDNDYTYDEYFVINEKVYDNYVDIYVCYNNFYYNGIDVYTIDNDKFISAYNILKENEIELIEFKEDYINAEVNLKEDKSVFTSIPYDKGWKVYSNDEQINTYSIDGALLGFDLDEGYNNIELRYIPPYFYLGATISGTTIILLGVYLIIRKRVINNRKVIE